MKVKKILALFLALCLTVSLPVNALAIEQDEDAPVEIAGESAPPEAVTEDIPADEPADTEEPGEPEEPVDMEEPGESEEPVDVEEPGEDSEKPAKSEEESPEKEETTATLLDAPTSGSCGDDARWSLDLDAGVLTISGNGRMDDFESDKEPWYNYRSNIQTINIENGITYLGTHAFQNSSVSNVSIPGSVYRIGNYAFRECRSLVELTVPEGVRVIGENALSVYNGHTWRRLSLPASLEYVGNSAFGENNITLSEIDYAGNEARWNAIHFGAGNNRALNARINYGVSTGTSAPELSIKNLKSGVIDEDIQWTLDELGVLKLSGTGRMEDFQSEYAPWYRDRDYIIAVEIEDGITYLGTYAFQNCKAVYAAIPGSVYRIGNYVFRECRSLVELTVPEGVRVIGENALSVYNGHTWRRLSLPASLEYVGNSAFGENNITLSEIDYAGNEAQWNAIHFGAGNNRALNAQINYGVSTGTSAPELSIKNLKSGVIDEDIQWTLDELGVLRLSGTGRMEDFQSEYAPWYRDRDYIIAVEIEDGITYLGTYAFQNCKAVYASIPGSVYRIGNYAFRECHSLVELTVPEGVRVIGENALSVYNGHTWRRLSLPASLGYVGNGAFGENNISFSEFDYAGTKSQWNAIHFGAGNNRALSAQINYGVSTGTSAPELSIKNLKSGVIDEDIQWTLDELGVLKLSGTGRMEDFQSERAPWYDDRDYIIAVEIEDGITYLGTYAFQNCKAVYASIPGSVYRIGNYAFRECHSLVELTVPEGVRVIGENALSVYNGHTWRRLSLPASLKYVGNSAFGQNNISFTEINYAGTKSQWNAIHFGAGNGTVMSAKINYGTLTESVDSAYAIGYLAKGNLNGSIRWTLDEFGVLTLSGTGAMEDYASGKSPWYNYRDYIIAVEIKDGITYLGSYAFQDCKAVYASIPGSVEKVGDYAFRECHSLVELTLPEGLKQIGNYAFSVYNSHTWRGLSLPASLESVGDSAFGQNNIRFPEIDYAGSKNQWGAIQFSSGNNGMINAKINYATPVPNPPEIVEVSGVSLKTTSLSLNAGDREMLFATVSPLNATCKTAVWTSSDPNVADVSYNGIVRGVHAGNTVITVTTEDGGKTATCTVTVGGSPTTPVSVTGVTLNKTSTTIKAGMSETLTATIAPANATNQNVTWSTSNASVAAVSNSGVVTAVDAGTATITVTTADGNKTASCTVIVTKDAQTIPVTGVRLDKDTLTLTEGGAIGGSSGVLTATITPANATNQNVTWSSADPSVAAVTDGKVFALKAGTTTVTVTTQDGNKTASCTVTVNPVVSKVTGISLNETDLRLNAGQSTTLTATVTPADASNKAVAWTSSAPAVAEVSENGTVTAKKGGEAVITAITAEGGFTASCTVTVERTMTGITVTKKPDKIVYNYNEELNTAGMVVSAVYDDGSYETVTGWTVRGYSKTASGSQTVTVAYQTYTAVFTVTVGEQPVSGTLPKPQMSVKSVSGGKQVTLTAPQGKIYYTQTLDGDTPVIPTASSKEYTGPIMIPATMTIKAIAIQDSSSSNVTSARISVSQVGTPAIFPGGSTVKDGALVTLRTDTTGADIYYTLDGSDPTPETGTTRKYNGAVLLREEDADANNQLTLKAIAVKDGYANSGTARTIYTMEKTQRPQNEVTVSLGSVSTKAGAVASVPLYLFSDSDVKSFQITAVYDKDAFENYVTVTPAQGIDASKLFLSNDNGILTLLYTGQEGIESGEVCTLNFTSLVSKANTTYPLNVVPEATTVSSGADVDVLLSFMNGVIELGDALKMELDASVSYTKKDGTEITADNINEGNTEEIEASVSINNPVSSSDNTTAGNTPSFGNLYLVIYNRYNQMVSVDTWRVDLSEPSFMFLQTIKIPPNVEVGAIKIMLLSDQMVPLMAANELAK